MHIKHLDGGHFFQNAARCESGSGLLELKLEGDMQAIGQEANEDVRFDGKRPTVHLIWMWLAVDRLLFSIDWLPVFGLEGTC